VGDIAAFKYRAFLSYSHRDMAWAKWLHARLEGFRIDKDLVGRGTPLGPVPKTLRPIFRDREDFSGGHTLTDATIAALDASAALIVLCSPVSASRPAVNREVQLFRSRHPDRPVIPVIIDGSWRDNYPPALRFELTPDGTLTDRPISILGPDLRESADGKSLGLAKTVAGLTGLSPDDVFRRAERTRRRQERLRAAAAAVFILLAIAGGGLYWQSYQQKQQLAEIAALVDRYSLASPAETAAPGAKLSLTQAITNIAEGAATDPRYAKALELLKAGNAAEAEPLLKAVAEDKARRADKDAKDAAAAYRNLASIAAVSDPGRAREYYAQAARLDPADVSGMLQNGWFQEEAGQFDAAQAAYSRVIATAKPGTDDDALVWAKFGIGDIHRTRGDLGAALETYHEAEAIADRLAQSDSGNAIWRRDLSVSFNKVGDVQVERGDLPAALASYEADLAISERLAGSDPGNADWQHDLSISYGRIGDVQKAQGDLAAAFTSYQASLAIREYVAKSDPSNAGWQRDLSVSYNEVGGVQVAQGNLPAAFASYQASLAIFDRLALSDPGNAGWQRDLSVSYEKVGDMQVAQGNLPAALASYQAVLAISERLAKSDPGNAGWQRDLGNAYSRIGNMQVAQGNLLAALASYQADLAISERLAQSDGGNAGWQRALSVSHDKVGDVQVAQGDLPAALASYQAGLAIGERLAQSDPSNAGWQRDLSMSYSMVGGVQVAQGNLPAALASYQASLAIRERLTRSDPGNAGWQRDLSSAYSYMGDVQVEQGNLPVALASYQSSLAIRDRLAKSDPGNADWQHDLSISYGRIGDVQKAQGDLPTALASYQASLAVCKALVAKDESNVQWRNDLQFVIGRIGGLAYNFVLARNFDEALKAADQAIALTPDAIWLYTNRAHALMFLGRTGEARALYLRYRAKKDVQDGKSWNAVILDDFTELRAAGLSNPLMDEIQTLFAQ
jgi:tetratricopeptide (TPR) repeat protein